MSKPERDALARVTARLLEFPGADQECGYLPGLTSRYQNLAGAQLRGSEYRTLLDANFRRAGILFYRPLCGHCQECRQMRVPVADFRPSKSQRRCLKRNEDLAIEAGPPELSEEKAELYDRYVLARHAAGPQSGGRDELEEFLYRTAVPTLEVTYRTPEGRLIAVSLLDIGSDYVSSVYHYFDPREAARSLGVFSVLAEIAFCREKGVRYYYLGYLVAGARTMAYKSNYRPYEVLVDGAWRRVDAES